MKNLKLLEKRRQLFRDIWSKSCITDIQNNREFVICFETGKKIYDNWKDNSCIYHHVLHKSKYKQYDLCEWNIILLTADIHEQVHNNIEKTPLVQIKTAELLEQHKLGILDECNQ